MTRTMTRHALILALTCAVAIALALPATAAPGAPNFSAGVYADGEAFGSKGTTDLPPPSGNNEHSFDPLIAITNGAAGQLPVAEAAPGDPAFNGGRWMLQEAAWTDAFLEMHDAPLLTSYADVLWHATQGHLVIATTVVRYFQCPLLPVK